MILAGQLPFESGVKHEGHEGHIRACSGFDSRHAHFNSNRPGGLQRLAGDLPCWNRARACSARLGYCSISFASFIARSPVAPPPIHFAAVFAFDPASEAGAFFPAAI